MTVLIFPSLIISVTLICVSLYFASSDLNKMELDIYEIHVIIDDNNNVNYTISLKADGLHGNQIEFREISIYVVNTPVKQISPLYVNLKKTFAYLVFNGTLMDDNIVKAIEDFKSMNIRVSATAVNEEGTIFSGQYNRDIKLYYKSALSKTYHFTKFDFFGISG
jgi:hypothetical protein